MLIAQVVSVDPWYLRGLLIVLSTFCGATAAFLLVRLARLRDEKVENIAAGNTALFAFIDQFNTLKLLGDQYLNEFRHSPDRWIELKEITEFPPYLRLSSANLRFLIRGGADATLLLRLHEAERNTDFAMQTLKARTAFFVSEIRPRLMPLFQTPPAGGLISVQTIEATLGHGLVVGLKERTDNLYETFDSAVASNELAFKMLQQHLSSKFPGADVLDRKIVYGTDQGSKPSLSGARVAEPPIIVPDWRYVAHLDMLGMSELTVRDPDLAWAALSKLDQAKEEILRLSIGRIATGEVISNRVVALTFSDTIIVFSQSDQPEDTLATVLLVDELFSRALSYSIPLRAGIADGRFLFNLDHGLFAGPPLVSAYHLCEQSQWLGIRLDKTVAERAMAIPLQSGRGRSAVVEWDLPVKIGSVERTERSYVLDWVETHRGNFKQAPPLTAEQFYVAFRQLFGEYEKLPRSAQRKYENTVHFVNDRFAA